VTCLSFEARIPVSTTHTITGAIVGVGATKGRAVRWGVAGRISGRGSHHSPSAAVAAAVFRRHALDSSAALMSARSLNNLAVIPHITSVLSLGVSRVVEAKSVHPTRALRELGGVKPITVRALLPT